MSKKSNSDYLLNLYYIVLWKSHSKKENILECIFTVLYFWKFVIILYKKYVKS